MILMMDISTTSFIYIAMREKVIFFFLPESDTLHVVMHKQFCLAMDHHDENKSENTHYYHALLDN